MKKRNKILFILIMMIVPLVSNANEINEDETTRKEREFIRNGNKLYNEKRYADAEVEYKKSHK